MNIIIIGQFHNLKYRIIEILEFIMNILKFEKKSFITSGNKKNLQNLSLNFKKRIVTFFKPYFLTGNIDKDMVKLKVNFKDSIGKIQEYS